MQALLNYDVTHKHVQVKTGLQKMGYLDQWKDKEVIYNLPDTTLWKNNTELNQALKDIQKVIADINDGEFFLNDDNKVKLKRCIVTSADPWVGIPGSTDRP